jgi:zinc protease
VVGDVDADEVVERLKNAVGSLKAEQPAFELPPPPSTVAEPRRAEKPIDRKQSHVVTGYESVDVKDPDRYPLTVLENILSGQGGRLFFELRDKKSLAYSVSAFFTKGLAPGLFGGYIGTDPSNAERALDGLLEEFEKVRKDAVRDTELARSQRYLIGARAIGLQTNGAKAEEMCLNELYGLGYRAGEEYEKKIAGVSAKDVQRVARKYLDPQRRAEVLVGPASAARSAAAH